MSETSDAPTVDSEPVFLHSDLGSYELLCTGEVGSVSYRDCWAVRGNRAVYIEENGTLSAAEAKASTLRDLCIPCQWIPPAGTKARLDAHWKEKGWDFEAGKAAYTIKPISFTKVSPVLWEAQFPFAGPLYRIGRRRDGVYEIWSNSPVGKTEHADSLEEAKDLVDLRHRERLMTALSIVED